MEENKFRAHAEFDITDDMTFAVYDASGLERLGTLSIDSAKIQYNKLDSTTVESIESPEALQDMIDEGQWMLKKVPDKKWVKYNPNPLKRNTGDCSIRAYCKAEGLDWNEAYDIATKYGRDMAGLPDDSKIVDKILQEEFGYTCTKIEKGKKKTVLEFAVDHPSGTYILKMQSHVVTVVDGKYYDTWDSGKRKIKCYYSK